MVSQNKGRYLYVCLTYATYATILHTNPSIYLSKEGPVPRPEQKDDLKRVISARVTLRFGRDGIA